MFTLIIDLLIIITYNLPMTNRNVGKKEITEVCKLYLESKNIKLAKTSVIRPVVDAVFFAMNILMKNDFNITVRNFGVFTIHEKKIRKFKSKLTEKNYTEKRRVSFRYTNKTFE